MRTDCHQHLWPESLLEALRARRRVPRIEGWTLHLDGEPPFEVPPADVDQCRRAARDRREGTERVLLSFSSPLGIEHLPDEEGAPLLAAWHDSVADLDPLYGVWAACGLAEPDPESLARVLAQPRVAGLQVPATALSVPAAVDRIGDLLQVLEQADRPLLVHPGPVRAPAYGPGSVPGWWPALVPYVGQMHSAWYSWHVAGRASFPRLRIAFVGLAGLAPLHHERLAARGGALGRIDPAVYYETSSYGTQAMDATLRVVGVDAMVHGSDRPYAEPTDPGLGAALSHALFVANPQRLLVGAADRPVPAAVAVGTGPSRQVAPRAV